MLNDLQAIIAEFKCVPKRLFRVVTQYIHYLTLQAKRHSFKGAAETGGLHESRFCSLLNDPETPALSRTILNRAVRRRLKKLRPIEGRYVLLIDATIKGRRGKKVENVRKYHSGSGYVNGHKFVNFAFLTPTGVIPLASLPSFTPKYCRENGIPYQTEIEIVVNWLSEFSQSRMLSEKQLKMALFLLDSGYDAKKIQRAIKQIGSNFVGALKSNRIVQGKQVKEYFRVNRRWLPWDSIRLHVGNGTKKSRRQYSIRTTTHVNLKGYGQVTVVYSKAISRARRPTKYLVASDPGMSGRQIVDWYSKRWSVELWHKEIKQNYGFGDCHSARFTAVASHVNFCLTAYLLQKEKGQEQMTIERHSRLNELMKIRRDLTKFGSITRLRTRIDQAIKASAA